MLKSRQFASIPSSVIKLPRRHRSLHHQMSKQRRSRKFRKSRRTVVHARIRSDSRIHHLYNEKFELKQNFNRNISKNSNKHETSRQSTEKNYSLTTMAMKCPITTNTLCDSEFHIDTRTSFPKWSIRMNSTDNIYDLIYRKKRRRTRCGYYCCRSPLRACLCIFSCLIITIGLLALLISLLLRNNKTSTTSRPLLSLFYVNLLTNGNGETGSCSNDSFNVVPPGWTVHGSMTQRYYRNFTTDDESFTSPGPTDRGNCYFTGYISASSSMWQTVNLLNYVDPILIDNHIVKFNLSAWIGGYSAQDDNAVVSLIFFNQFNQTIGNETSIGSVLAIDRGNKTALVFRQMQGFVPIGTRFLRVIVTSTRNGGYYNNGNSDNISVFLYP